MFDPSAEPFNIRLMDVLEDKSQLLKLAAMWNENHPEKPIDKKPAMRNGFLTMSNALMMSFFEPLLLSTVNETRRVLKQIPGIRHIMVVGGFGSSKVLTSRIQKEFHNKGGVKVLCPDARPKPQGAIVHGAVYYGLHKDIISSRVAGYSYGVAVRENGVSEVFSKLVSKGQELPAGHEETLTATPSAPEQTEMKWRVYRSDLENPTTVTGEHMLGYLIAKCPPNDDEDKREQTGVFNFSGSEIRVTIRDFFNKETKGEISMT